MGKAPEGADSQFCVGEGMILNDRGGHHTLGSTSGRGTVFKEETETPARWLKPSENRCLERQAWTDAIAPACP